MKTVGLTGGIGSGKTTVAKGLEQLGAALIDADSKGHIVLEIPEIKLQLADVFGNDIFVEQQIDRKKLAERAFANSDSIRHLNRIVHPKILTLIAEDLQTLSRQDYPYIVIDAALLFEVNLDKLCDCTVTVDAPVDQCFERVQKRNQLSKSQIRKRMRFQLSFSEKREKADYVLLNDVTLDQLQRKIIDLHWILQSC